MAAKQKAPKTAAGTTEGQTAYEDDATVKLFNKGERTIYCDNEYAFTARAVHEFSGEEASRLTRLYPNEVLDLDEAGREDKAAAQASEDADA